MLAFNSVFAIDGVAVASDDPPAINSSVEADVSKVDSKDFDDQSDSNRGTPALTVPTDSSSWVMALFNFFGFGR